MIFLKDLWHWQGELLLHKKKQYSDPEGKKLKI